MFHVLISEIFCQHCPFIQTYPPAAAAAALTRGTTTSLTVFITPTAVAMCLVGHVMNDVKFVRLNEYLLHMPMNEMFRIISGDLSKLEGCCVYFDKKK